MPVFIRIYSNKKRYLAENKEDIAGNVGSQQAALKRRRSFETS